MYTHGLITARKFSRLSSGRLIPGGPAIPSSTGRDEGKKGARERVNRRMRVSKSGDATLLFIREKGGYRAIIAGLAAVT